MPRVLTAQPSGSQSMGSLGRAAHMLIRQHNFPDTYADNEHLTGADSDRLAYNNYKQNEDCLQRHTGVPGDMGLASWAWRVTCKELLAFCVDALQLSSTYSEVLWTGCRILGTVNRSNGHSVWTIEVFAKDPNGTTKVYSTSDNAPNVQRQETYFEDGSGRAYTKTSNRI